MEVTAIMEVREYVLSPPSPHLWISIFFVCFHNSVFIYQFTFCFPITGYGTTNYNSGYGSGLTGMTGLYGGSGGLYGGGMYGNSMYRGGYGGLYGGSSGMYGAGSSGMYGGGMYNSGMGGPMGGYGMGMGGPYGGQDPNDPYGAPPSAPGFWVSALHVVSLSYFGLFVTSIGGMKYAWFLMYYKI